MWKKIKTILEKAAVGSTLSEEEKALLAQYDEPENLAQQIQQLQAEKEEIANAGKPELQRLKEAYAKLSGQFEETARERDAFKAAKESLVFDSAVHKIAGKYRFTDPDFLRFKLSEQKVNPEDEAGIDTFMQQLKNVSPKFFAVEVNRGGAGATEGKNIRNDSATTDSSRIGRMMAALQDAADL